MAITFEELNLTAPDGSIIGIITDQPFEKPGVLQHPLCTSNAVTRAREISKYLARRQAGETIVMVTHDEALVESCADEVWWFHEGQLAARGDPSEVLPLYRRYVSRELRNLNDPAVLAPVMRNGDGRATLESIELSNTLWQSGENVSVRVTIRYNGKVDQPVIGILIRTRIGLNVYGTNTGLEHIETGPVVAGDRLITTFRFKCDLCPGDYTITAASHDPDGLWHDWLEDAVRFAVTDSRYTAGVANLRAQVYVQHEATSPQDRSS